MKTAPIDQIFVTWTQQWDVDEYIDRYLRSRRLPESEKTRAAILAFLQTYPGCTPHTKSDLDYYLDRNIGHRR